MVSGQWSSTGEVPDAGPGRGRLQGVGPEELGEGRVRVLSRLWCGGTRFLFLVSKPPQNPETSAMFYGECWFGLWSFI